MVTALPAQLTCACPSIDLALRRHVARESPRRLLLLRRSGSAGSGRGGTGQCPGEDDGCMTREIARERRERDVALALASSRSLSVKSDERRSLLTSADTATAVPASRPQRDRLFHERRRFSYCIEHVFASGSQCCEDKALWVLDVMITWQSHQ